MTETYDVVVVGGGPAGENVAGRCIDGGMSVILVEAELLGGECSFWGCMPSKTLIRAGDVLATARRVPGLAEVMPDRVDVEAVFARRNLITQDWTDGWDLEWIQSKGIALARGQGRLAGPRTVEVTAATGTRTLVARSAVALATGTRASIPPIAGLQQSRPWDNRHVTSATHLPGRLLVLGGGAIGVEMAQAYLRLGCESVTLIEAQERLVPNEEPFASAELRSALEAEGMAVLVGSTAAKVVRDVMSNEVTVTLTDGRELIGDEILVAVGRVPNVDDVGLETLGLDPSAALDVDDALRVRSVPDGWLYSVGDCNRQALFTHMAKYQARLAADAILGRPLRPHAVVPRVIFTDPQIAAVGLTEAEARAQGLDVRQVSYAIGDMAGMYTLGDGITGTGAIVVDESRGVIVGATFTGPEVVDVLHSATVAIVGEVPLERLWHAVPAFPTVSEIWLRLLETYGL